MTTRRPNVLLLAAAVAAAGCATDHAPASRLDGETPAKAEAPPGGSNPAPVLIGVAVGAALVIALIANSGLGPSPDPPG